MTYKILNTKTKTVIAAGLSLNEANYFIRTHKDRCIFLPEAI